VYIGGREGFLDDSDAKPLTLGGFATAFYSGLWAYDGWNNLVEKLALTLFFKNALDRFLLSLNALIKS
jgi:hypothetical protein